MPCLVSLTGKSNVFSVPQLGYLGYRKISRTYAVFSTFSAAVTSGHNRGREHESETNSLSLFLPPRLLVFDVDVAVRDRSTIRDFSHKRNRCSARCCSDGSSPPPSFSDMR